MTYNYVHNNLPVLDKINNYVTVLYYCCLQYFSMSSVVAIEAKQ